jgi:Tfp pilus assembly protein PilZ
MQAKRSRDDRVGQRVESQLNVHYGVHACDRSAKAQNISKEGLFISTNTTYPAGTQLMIQIEFPDTAFFHRVEVIWAIRVPEHMEDDLICGMGVKFIEPDASWLKFFHNWKTKRFATA